MKILVLTLAILAFPSAASADEFGSMFQNTAPSALSEDIQNPETAAQDETGQVADIEPAAGEAAIPSNDPRQDEAIEEQELEKATGAQVETTLQSRGDGQFKEHNSIGAGKVRVFNQKDQDTRVNDDNDAIGVEFKILEFK